MDLPGQLHQRRQDVAQSLNSAISKITPAKGAGQTANEKIQSTLDQLHSTGSSPPLQDRIAGFLNRTQQPPTYHAATVRRMAQASDVAYSIEAAGGQTSSPNYAPVGFLSEPTTVVGRGINAALIGTTAQEIVVAFRGTSPVSTDNPQAFFNSIRDWLKDAQARLVNADYTTGEIHRGFKQDLDSLWSDLLSAVRQQISQHNLPVLLTGHSKGGALARLAALRLQTEAGITTAGVYTYAAPRVGNAKFAKDYAARITADWRFENTDDIVPHLPPAAAAIDLLSATLIDPLAVPRYMSRAYASVGLLEFLKWDGSITEGDSLLLQGQRTAHLAEIIAANDLEQITNAHSLESAYLPRL